MWFLCGHMTAWLRFASLLLLIQWVSFGRGTQKGGKWKRAARRSGHEETSLNYRGVFCQIVCECVERMVCIWSFICVYVCALPKSMLLYDFFGVNLYTLCLKRLRNNSVTNETPLFLFSFDHLRLQVQIIRRWTCICLWSVLDNCHSTNYLFVTIHATNILIIKKKHAFLSHWKRKRWDLCLENLFVCVCK